MNDLISREDALNFEMDLEAENDQEMFGIVRGMQIYANHIKNLPGFGWTPIDQKPIKTGLYLVLRNELGKEIRKIWFCTYCHETDKWIDVGKKHINYWMLLPELPKEE